MADNTQLNTGTGGDIISTDVVTTLNGGSIATGEKAQRVKIGWGVDGTFNDTNASNPLPISLATAPTTPVTGTFWQATQPVSASTLPLPTGASTSAAQTTGNASLASIDGKITAVNTGAVTISAALPAGSNTIGAVNQGTSPWSVKNVAKSVSSQTALTTTATVSGAAGTFQGGSFMNLNAAPAYIQVFDTTGAVTLGTTTPTFVQSIPANATPANGAAYVFDIVGGIGITNGIKVAATTTATGATTVTIGLTGYIAYL